MSQYYKEVAVKPGWSTVIFWVKEHRPDTYILKILIQWSCSPRHKMSSPTQNTCDHGFESHFRHDICLLVRGSCEHINEPFVSTDDNKFLEELSSCQLLRKTCSTSYLVLTGGSGSMRSTNASIYKHSAFQGLYLYLEGKCHWLMQHICHLFNNVASSAKVVRLQWDIKGWLWTVGKDVVVAYRMTISLQLPVGTEIRTPKVQPHS
jgi:hypothetical protein